MFQLDAIALSQAVKQRLVDFALDDHFVRDSQLTEICRELWSGNPENGGLLSDLWVEGAFPAKAANESVEDLVKQGRFNAELCHHLDKRRVIPKQRKLYLHQRDAILAAQSLYHDAAKPALVVTAGTGTGKTESFLLPILNDLFTNHEKSEPGVKCIILYPMNALVNDQVDRLYEWLQGQCVVTLFHFTSETPEDRSRADKEGIHIWDACRMRTRREARGLETHDGRAIDIKTSSRGPVPDIIITNYSMLEYMLSRPQDAVFFGKTLRTIVLDEAHLYTGTLAAEITLLLRRLLDRCERLPEHILQIATSATIGKDTGESGELEDFAAQLFTKDRSLIKVIRGESTRISLPSEAQPEHLPSASTIVERTWLTDKTIEMNASHNETILATNATMCQALARSLSLLVDEQVIKEADRQSENKPAMLLYYALGRSPLLHRLEAILWERKQLSLHDLVQDLWGTFNEDARHATMLLLQMAAAARRNISDYPLLPNRIHLLARPTDGLVVCLNSECNGPDYLKLTGLGCIAEGLHDRCAYCQNATLSLYRCANCGKWVVAGMKDKDNTSMGLKPVPSLRPSRSVQFLALEPYLDAVQINIDSETARYDGYGNNKSPFYAIEVCPWCNDSDVENWKPFAQLPTLALSILTESVLTELPVYPAPYYHWLPARGRRMLIFSDSRQGAARLGPRLTRQHEIQLVRAAMVACLRKSPIVNPELIEQVQCEIDDLEQQLAQDNLSLPLRQYKARKLEQTYRQYTEYNAGGSLDDWTIALAKIKGVQELIDVETSTRHDAALWLQRPQDSWDENTQHVQLRLKSLLAREFARPTQQQISLETLGLAEVTYPGLDALTLPEHLEGTLPTRIVRERIQTNWTAFLAALCDTLRTDGVITLGSDIEDKAYQFAILIGNWCAEEKELISHSVRFVGATVKQRRRAFAAEIARKCDIPDSDVDRYAQVLLRVAFQQLQANAGNSLLWLETRQRQSKDGGETWAIRIRFSELGLRRPLTLYRSVTTGHIWMREVLGCAPETNCNHLEQVDDEQLNNDTRIMRQRREFTSSPVFTIGLWAEEHSAQLSPKENRRLQDLFKYGIRNILSSTTTMELGIDIGGLNAVLMSNVPPGKANYLQRAGRAGRRADGSSIVVTFCHPHPFDREVFLRFGSYLASPLRSPNVFLDRKRIAIRHNQAFLLGNFFREIYPPNIHVGAMRAFGDMGHFCGVSLPPKWERAAEKPLIQPDMPDRASPTAALWWNPDHSHSGLEGQFVEYLCWIRDRGEVEVRPHLERLLQGTGAVVLLNDWFAFLNGMINDFTSAIYHWRVEFDAMLNAWQQIDSTRTAHYRAQANALRYQMAALYETTVIETLADQQFMPRYGFPIGTQRLRVIIPDERYSDRYREEDQYRLERSGLIAMGEYVPGSQLLIGGKLITSRGLLKHWTGADINNYLGLRGQYTTCDNNHLYYKISTGSLGMCPICGAEPKSSPSNFLLPMHGFSSAAWDPPKISTDVERIGHTEQATITFIQRDGADVEEQNDFGSVIGLRALYREDGELLVYNAGEYQKGFAICLKCGYADSEKYLGDERIKLPSGFERHAPLTSTKEESYCWGKYETPGVLRNHTLAARQTTDILLLDFSFCLNHLATNAELLWTLAQALEISGAKLLELDSRELGTLVIPAGDRGRGFGAVLYDNVPGGAGHVRELLALGRQWLEEARNVMFVNEEHNQTCETACLDCLLTFDTQEPMRRGLLQRQLAIRVLDALLNGNELPQIEATTIGISILPQSEALTIEESAKSVALSITSEDRLQRARLLIAKRDNHKKRLW